MGKGLVHRSRRPIAVGAATVHAGRGGISRVARLMIKAFAADPIEAISLLDDGSTDVAGVLCRGVAGNRLRFVVNVFAFVQKRRVIFYDSAGIARAHPRLLSEVAPYITWIHGIDVWESMRPQRKRAISAAKLVLVNSNYTLERCANLHGPIPQAKVCWLATEEDEPPADPPDFSGPPMVLMVSRIELGETYKGHDHVLAAWPVVLAAAPNARLVIVGDGDGFERVQALAAASTAASSITMTGFIPDSDIHRYWRAAHVFCMPSTCEGFGLVYVEAMRYGLPVIASIHDAGREVNVDGVSGFNVDLAHPGELADHLITLLTDRSRAQSMGQAGFRRWREHFCYSAFRSRFFDIILPLVLSKN